MIQASDSKGGRISKEILYIVGIFALAVLEFFLGKWGWYLLPVVVLVAIPVWRHIQNLPTPERQFIRIKSIKPKRDSWR